MTDDASKYLCPACGHRRTSARCWNCDVGDGGERIGYVDLAAAVVTTAALQPFLTALATKAGEAVWPKIADLVRSRREEETEARLADADLLEIVVQNDRFVFEMPKRLPADAFRDLRDVVTALETTDGRFRISYDAASRTWEIAPEGREDEPPGDASGG